VRGLETSGVRGRSPDEGMGAKCPEAEKHDINFALRTTLVNAYYPFYSLYIITFGIGYPRSVSSHISDFQSLPHSSTPPLCVHTSHRIYAILRIEYC